MFADRKTRRVFEFAGLAVMLVLFVLTAWHSFGWDDEISSMNIVEEGRAITELIKYMSSWDVHPAGQYVICNVLYGVLGSWKYVRVFGAVIVSLSLWLYWKMTAKPRPDSAVLFSYIFLCLNPSILLWCTSVRWYTWIIPPMCFLGALLHMAGDSFTKRGRLIFWSCYYAVSIILFHIAYCSIIIILVSFACLLWERRKFLHDEMRVICGLGALSVIIVVPQSYIFLTVHFPAGSSKLVSMITSLVAAGQNFLCGSALVPVSPAGILLLLGSLAVFFAFLFNMKYILSKCPGKFVVISYAVNILLKCAPMARYYTCFHPQAGDFMADSYSCIKNKAAKISVLALYLAGSIWGIANVMTHNDTAKAGWDTPYEDIFRRIDEIDPGHKALVVTSNPTIAYHMKKSGRIAVDIQAHEIPAFSGPTIAVKTYVGSLNRRKYDEYVRLIENAATAPGEKLGRDKYAWFKKKMASDYPDYYAEIFTIGM